MNNKLYHLKQNLSKLGIKISFGSAEKLYSFCRTQDLESIMKIGLCSSKYIVENEEILFSIFSEKDAEEFKNRYDPDDIAQNGISVFFNKYTLDEILALDPNHPLSEEDYTLLEINYSQMKNDGIDFKIMGMELIPYENQEYDDKKEQIEKILTEKDIEQLGSLPFDEAWANYFSGQGFFAPNVPHGIVLIDVILPEYLKVI